MTKRAIVIVLLIGAVGAGAFYMRRGSAEERTPASAAGGGGRARGGGGGGFGGGFGGPRLPMTVELASVKRADMAEKITVVGNLIGEATVEAVPKVAGRIETIS